LAAFLGAKYAFSLQALKAEREVIESNVAAGNRAVFSFVRKYNKLNNIQTQFLEPYRGDPTAFIQMQPLLDLVKDDINIGALLTQ